MADIIPLNDDSEYLVTCPVCGGTAWELISDQPGEVFAISRYRCLSEDCGVEFEGEE